MIKEKESVFRSDVLCARCQHREECRGINGPFWTNNNKCEEFKRDWNLILRKDRKVK